MGRIRGPRAKRKRELIHRLAEAHGWCCFYCERPLSYEGPKHLRPTLDHVVPLGEGGTNHFRNLVIACRRCNHRKGGTHGDALDRTRLRRGTEHDGSQKCGLCGRSPAAGFAAIDDTRYCHEGDSPTCYESAQTGSAIKSKYLRAL